MNATRGTSSIGSLRSRGAPSTAGIALVALFVTLILCAGTIAGARSIRFAIVGESRLVGDVSVAVWGAGLESADAAAARAVEALSTLPEIKRVALLEPEVSDDRFGRLILGRATDGEPPRLISVTMKGGAGPGSRLVERLRAMGIQAAGDDHRNYRSPLERRALAVIATAFAGAAASCAVLLFASIRAGEAVVARHRARLELMIRLGARVGWVGALVWRAVGLSVLLGALTGLALIEGGYFIFGNALEVDSLLVGDPSPSDAAFPLLWPPLVVLIAFAGAGLGSRGPLTKAERPG